MKKSLIEFPEEKFYFPASSTHCMLFGTLYVRIWQNNYVNTS